MMALAEMIVMGLALWVVIGVVVGLVFLIFGVSRIDAAASGASPLFRPAVFLGCVVLWPAVLIRWMSGVRINDSKDDAP